MTIFFILLLCALSSPLWAQNPAHSSSQLHELSLSIGIEPLPVTAIGTHHQLDGENLWALGAKLTLPINLIGVQSAWRVNADLSRKVWKRMGFIWVAQSGLMMRQSKDATARGFSVGLNLGTRLAWNGNWLSLNIDAQWRPVITHLHQGIKIEGTFSDRYPSSGEVLPKNGWTQIRWKRLQLGLGMSAQISKNWWLWLDGRVLVLPIPLGADGMFEPMLGQIPLSSHLGLGFSW